MNIFLIENDEKQGDTLLLQSNFSLKYVIMKAQENQGRQIHWDT
jgi:hypothetical protein